MKKLIFALLLLAPSYGISSQVTQKQFEQKMAGTWHLVSVTFINSSGERTRPYGDDPQGLLIFDKGGEYATQILRTGRPKFASGNKARGTADENRSLVIGSNSHFGTYVLDSRRMTVTFKIISAFFPNWESTEQTMTVLLKEGKLTLNAPTSTSGGKAEVVWKR